jgi:H+/Cl- antiporter ClcA
VISIPKNTDGYTIFDSIIYIICGSFIGISTLKNILEIFGINADKNILKKNKKNENYIYSFPISRIIICIVSATICLFSNLLKSSNNESIIVFIFSNFNSDTIYLLFFIFYLISLASIILIVIGVFFGKNIAPKENEELKKKLIREYELKLKKESIDKKDSTNNKRK